MILCMIWLASAKQPRAMLLSTKTRTLWPLSGLVHIQDVYSWSTKTYCEGRHLVHQGHAQQPRHCAFSSCELMDSFNPNIPLLAAACTVSVKTIQVFGGLALIMLYLKM